MEYYKLEEVECTRRVSRKKIKKVKEELRFILNDEGLKQLIQHVK